MSCLKPLNGWTCTRDSGHAGPCAAIKYAAPERCGIEFGIAELPCPMPKGHEGRHSHGVTSHAASAWEILSNDRDEWKNRALRAEKDLAEALRRLEQEIACVRHEAGR